MNLASVLTAEHPSLGQCVDLAFVENDQEAKIISFAAKAYIDAVICEDVKDSMFYYKEKRLKVHSVDLACKKGFRVYSGSTKSRPRNEAERLSKKLPLPPLLGDATGNPRYMVNIIQLRPDNERLRDSIFHAIFGRNVLIDTLNDAVEYTKKCGSNPAPNFFTLTGDTLKVTNNYLVSFFPSLNHSLTHYGSTHSYPIQIDIRAED